MAFLSQLWLPILLSAAAAWIWSFLSWAILNIHSGDFKKLPDEPRALEALRGLNLPPEYYSFPHMLHSDRKDPEGIARWKAGPLGVLHVWSPQFSMPRNMILSYLVYLAVSFLMAYIGYGALPAGVSFARAFQTMGAMGILAYSFAFLPVMIWFQGRPRVVATAVLDGVIMGLATGAVFAALWPKV
jgi:hypothetical protein